jgi:hypothetical protein
MAIKGIAQVQRSPYWCVQWQPSELLVTFQFYAKRKKHVITTQTEHKCVLDSCR